MKARCPYADDLSTLGDLVAAMTHDNVQPMLASDNPYGMVVIIYCRDCDCTHTSIFDAQNETSHARARAACVDAAIRLTDPSNNEEKKPHGKTRASKSN